MPAGTQRHAEAARAIVNTLHTDAAGGGDQSDTQDSPSGVALLRAVRTVCPIEAARLAEALGAAHLHSDPLLRNQSQ